MIRKVLWVDDTSAKGAKGGQEHKLAPSFSHFNSIAHQATTKGFTHILVSCLLKGKKVARNTAFKAPAGFVATPGKYGSRDPPIPAVEKPGAFFPARHPRVYRLASTSRLDTSHSILTRYRL